MGFPLLKICVRSQKVAWDPKKVAWDPKKGAWVSQKRCLTIVRHVFCDLFWYPKIHAWYPKIHTEEYRSAGRLSSKFFGMSGTFFGDCQASFFGSQATFLGSHTYFYGTKRSQNGVNRYFFKKIIQMVFVPSIVNVWYKSQHSDHVNHPFKADLLIYRCSKLRQ